MGRGPFLGGGEGLGLASGGWAGEPPPKGRGMVPRLGLRPEPEPKPELCRVKVRRLYRGLYRGLSHWGMVPRLGLRLEPELCRVKVRGLFRELYQGLSHWGMGRELGRRQGKSGVHWV
jgi:hypothetical protein